MRLCLLFAVATHICAALSPSYLRCEYLVNPEGIDPATLPRLTWLVESPERGAKQSAYRILAASSAELLARNRGDLWDSGKVESAATVNIPYAGKVLQGGSRYWWKVQVWDGNGKASGWSAPARWSTGPDAGAWTAQWISHRDDSPMHRSRTELYLPAARYYRKPFSVEKTVRRATLHGSALGVFDAYVNGRRVSDAMFSPGWSDYRRRALFRSWDVTSLLARGGNAVGAEVAEGWYSGYVGYGLLVGYGPYRTGRAMYGKTPALLLQLQIEYSDGTTGIVGTDPTWKVAESPRREADILMGESYDARREQPGWAGARFDDAAWEKAVAAAANGSVKAVFSDRAGDREMEFGFVRPPMLRAHPGPPVRPIEELRPKRILKPAPSAWVFDFGQNFSGVVRVKAKGPAGTKIRIRHAEMVYPDGRLMTENLRKARATDFFTLRGDASGESYTPRFTYHGFQYAELTGYPGEPSLDDVTGVVVHSDTPLTSRFESSDPMANKLFQNIVWTQRSNFVEVPTDCPQRDERLGWTGDAQVYARAASFHADTAAFYTKWLEDLNEAQLPNGAYPDYAPYPMQHGSGGYAYGTGWMDAGVIVPWAVWRAYGDLGAIDRHWRNMARFIDFRKKQSPDLRGSNKFNPWGDWLSIGSTTPVEYIDSVYFAWSTELMRHMAAAVHKSAERDEYAKLWRSIRERFGKDYVTGGGLLRVPTQTAYALALAYNLNASEAPEMPAELAKMIRDNGYRMTTGFLGTYPLLTVLSDAGYHDIAVRLFQSRQFPSWGYEVENGATTVWERWNSYTKDKGFFSPAMNSFSHYAFGAVSEWMFRRLAGIDGSPGFRTVVIRPGPPSPGSNPDQPPIDWVSAEYKSIRGTIKVRWKREHGAFTLEATVPANVSGVVMLPARDARSVTESGKPVKVERFDGGKAEVPVEAGTYRFRAAL